MNPREKHTIERRLKQVRREIQEELQKKKHERKRLLDLQSRERTLRAWLNNKPDYHV